MTKVLVAFIVIFLAEPIVSITFDGETFSGTAPSNKVRRVVSETYWYDLTGLYENAATYATIWVFDSPDGGLVSQRLQHHHNEDASCNHQG